MTLNDLKQFRFFQKHSGLASTKGFYKILVNKIITDLINRENGTVCPDLLVKHFSIRDALKVAQHLS